jgi:threonyl-tRNA synthetase
VQIDVENAETFDISYVAADGSRKRPVITHASISGSIERVVYALLEQQAMRAAEGKAPMLPVWLSPTQVRVIPVADRHNDLAKEVAEQLELNNIRADVDDRTETLQKKVRDAEREWVPFIIVAGDREKEGKRFAVRIRGSKEQKEMALEELTVLVRSKADMFPFEPLTLPKLLSKRPIFSG